MKKRILSIYLCLLLILPAFAITAVANEPPNTPTIDGPSSGKPGVEYDFIFYTADPNDDEVYYCVSWGCCGGGDFHTYGPYTSGVEVTLSHSWSEQGDYVIQAYAKDIHEAESDTATFELTIHRNKSIQNTMFQWFLERYTILQMLITRLGL
jgi:hypothetical protein